MERVSLLQGIPSTERINEMDKSEENDGTCCVSIREIARYLIKNIHYLYLHEWQKEECVIYIFMYMKTRANYVSHIFSSPVSFDLEGFNISFCFGSKKIVSKKNRKNKETKKRKREKMMELISPFS